MPNWQAYDSQGHAFGALNKRGRNCSGLFVCSGGFTKDAEAKARTQAKLRVTLIGLEMLLDLWVANYANLSDEAQNCLPLRPYFLAPKP